MNTFNKITRSFTWFLVLGFLLILSNHSQAVVLNEDVDISGNAVQSGVSLPSAGDSESIEPQYAPGEVIVKLKTDSQDVYTQSYSQRKVRDESVLTGLKSKYNLRDEEPVFKGLHKQLESGDLSLQAHQIETAAKFPKRARPKDAEKVDLLPIYVLKTDGGVLEACAELNKDPDVEYAQPNYIYAIQDFPETLPNDTYVNPSGDGVTWSAGAWGQEYEDLWGLKSIEADKAWGISQGEGIVVAVIDTGVDYNHEDIAENIWINSGEIPDNAFDDDGNGCVDDVHGFDFAYNDGDPMDGHYHGTHCAGTIAAVGNNAKGVIGVAPKARIMAVKGLSDSGSGNTAILANCIKYAADNGAHVLSNSWGPGGRRPSDPGLEGAIDDAYSLGCVVVFAAGNSDDDVGYYSPANYSKTVAVAATDSNDQRAGFSNYGDLIDVAAPGVDILSLRANDIITSRVVGPEGKYSRKSGTSMACPHVAGLAAGILTLNPSLSQEEVRTYIKDCADSIVTDRPVGAGRINAKRVMQNIPLGEFCHITKVEFVSGSGNKINIYARVNIPNLQGAALTLKKAGSDDDISIPMPDPGTIPQNTEFLIATYYMNFEETVYGLTLECVDATGDSYFGHLGFLVDNFRIDALENEEGEVVHVLNEGIFYIRATILGDHFNSFTLEYKTGAAWETEGVTILHSGPCSKTIIASLDTSYLDEDGYCTLRLSGEYDGFSITEIKVFFYSKDMHDGWPQQVLNNVWIGVYSADLDGDGIEEIITRDRYKIYVWNENGELLTAQRPSPKGLFRDGLVPLSFAEIDSNPGAEIIYGYFAPYENPYGYRIAVATFQNNTLHVIDGWSDLAFYVGDLVSDAWGSDIVIEDLEGNGNKNIIFIAREFIAWGSLRHTFKVFIFNSDGSELRPDNPIMYERLQSLWPGTPPRWRHPFICLDIDNDGVKEIIVANYELDNDERATIRLDAWRIDGTPYQNGSWPVVIPYYYYQADRPVGEILVGDVNRDGEEEIVFNTIDGYLGIVDKRGDFLYDTPVKFGDPPIGYTLSCDHYRPMALCDFEKDGYLEIVASIGNELHVFNYDGTERFSPMLSSGNIMGITIGDIDDDDVSDIIYVASGNILAFDMYGNPIRRWEALGDYYRPQVRDRAPRLSDIDNDGKLEMLCLAYTGIKAYINIWDLDAWGDSTTVDWPMARHNLQHTGCYPPHVGNYPPDLESIGDKKTYEGKILQFTVYATDPDGDPLKYSAWPLPRGAKFDEERRTFSWKPTYDQAGKYPVTFTVSDPGSLTDSETIIIKVNDVNRLPDLESIGNKKTDEGKILKFTVNAKDPDGDPLKFSAGPLPMGASFDRLNRTFIWRPTYTQAGEYKITFTVSDPGSLTDSETIIIKVNDANRILTPDWGRIQALVREK